MAVDYFLKLDGIDGESTDDKHKGEIDVESFSWGVARPAGATTGATKAAATAVLQPLSFTSATSKASPKLFLACASGQHLKQAVLTVTRSGEKGAEPFMTFVFNDVLVSAYRNGGSDLPQDSSSLSYASVLVNSVGTKPPAPAAPIVIDAFASGALVRYMDDQTTEIAPSQDGDLLQSGYVYQVFGNLSIPRQFRRGFAEFDLSQTVVAGIAKGPGATKAKYELILTNVAPPPSDGGGGVVISDPGPVQTGDTGPGRHVVRWWEGPDLEVTPADYDREAAELGKIMNTAPGASHAFDVTQILGASTSRKLGFRVQLVDDPDRTGFASIGSQFRAELRLTLT